MNRPADDDLRPDSYRGVAVCAVLAVLAVAIGVVAVVADEAALALAAAVIGVTAAGIGSFLDVRRARSDRSLLEARAQARRLRRELQFLQATAAETEHDGAELPDDLAAGTDDWEIDPVSGLLRERHLPVLLQQVVAAARRKVLPVSVVFWEIDGLRGGAASRPRPGGHCARCGGVAHAARERRAVPHRRRRGGRRCSSTPPSPAR